MIDVLLALLGLLVLMPVIIACAIGVGLTSPGPVIFRQQRVGRSGTLFWILKFRTMRTSTEQDGPLVATISDPRITRIGRFLRHYKLDEIPQLINVVKGDMSIVGPRPEVPKYVATYPAAEREKILSVRPGMTDLASIAFIQESAILSGVCDPEQSYIHVVLPAKRRLCLEYVDRQSIWLDVTIMFRTLRALLRSGRVSRAMSDDAK